MKQRSIPFGYAMKNGAYIQHPQESEVVRQIFSQYASGLGYKAITKRLNDGDISYLPKHAWNHNMVKRILENRRYVGEQEYPAIIAPAVFESAAERRNANAPCCRRKSSPQPETVDHYSLCPYEPNARARRMAHEINRSLEKITDADQVRQMIYSCAAEKYSSIKGAQFER